MNRIGERVTGTYYGTHFEGVIRDVEPDWTAGATNERHYYIDLDKPTRFQISSRFVDTRTSLALMSMKPNGNIATGKHGCTIAFQVTP